VHKVAKSNQNGTYSEHFFGSIVYVIEESGFGVPDRYVLTDGQQRITTTMLFLMALRDSISDERYRNTIQRRYIENERADDLTEYKIKLKQVETDWEAYKLLALGKEVPPAAKNSSVYQNYQFFLKALRDVNEDDRRALLEQGLNRFSVISIQLEPERNPWENPQEIFESMNSLGKPLSLADLVRNYLLMGQSSATQARLYSEYWLTLEKRLPGRLSHFVRDWMQADQHRSYRAAQENNYKELYSAFKSIVQQQQTEKLFDEFVRFSRPYAIVTGIEKSSNDSIDQLISDLNIIQVAPVYSYLSEVLRAWHEGLFTVHAVEQILLGIRTYLLRRRILGLTAGENKFFPTFGSHLDELIQASDVRKTIYSLLSSQEYALRLPNDQELKTRLETINFYNLGRSRNHPRLLLSLLEEHLTKSRPDWDDPDLQLEHIMPQTLGKSWRSSLGEDPEQVHQEFVNNLGNITLIRHNQELGNRSFQEKKAIYALNSGLQISQNYILDVDDWGQAEIERRQDYLVNLILEHVLAVPEPFKYSSNWKQSSTNGRFDSRHVLAQLISERIHYMPNKTITAVVVSDSKVEFEGREWSLSPLTRELRRREGKLSDSGSYQGAYYWGWGDERLVDVEL